MKEVLLRPIQNRKYILVQVWIYMWTIPVSDGPIQSSKIVKEQNHSFSWWLGFVNVNPFAWGAWFCFLFFFCLPPPWLPCLLPCMFHPLPLVPSSFFLILFSFLLFLFLYCRIFLILLSLQNIDIYWVDPENK